jgi:hypothetical protein
MQTQRKPRTGADKVLRDLVELEYFTITQVVKVGGFKATSLPYLRRTLRELIAVRFAATLPRQLKTQPLVYTPTTKGYRYAAALGMTPTKRVRPVDERDKARNTLYIQHTLAVSDVLIAAKLLSHAHPQVSLTRLYTERSLKRKIAVTLADNRTHYIEPDASCEFLLTETWHTPPQTWQDFFHIEVYRHLPLEVRFKQKVRGYVTSLDTGTHEALFKTAALSIAVFCETRQQAVLLKRWTEETLTDMGRMEEGERFFFRSIDLSSASPSELYQSPDWQQAFGETTTPLLVLE